MATPVNNLDPQLIISKLLADLGNPWLPVHEQALEQKRGYPRLL